MFEFFIVNEAQIPAEHKAFYEQRGASDTSPAGWYLKVNGAVARTRLDEFRANNDTLKEEKKALEDKLKLFEGLDAAKVREVMAREQEIMGADMVKAGKVNDLVAERLKASNEDHDRQIKAKDATIKEKDTKVEQLSGQLKTVKIDNALLAEANKRGLQPGAETFLLAAARSQWDLNEDGKPFVKDGAGKIRYGKNGDAMEAGEWMDELSNLHSFMFKPNQGSGAGGGGGGGGGQQGDGQQRNQGGGTDVNWWKKEHFNVTKQMEVYKADPAKAKRMANEAGAKLIIPTPQKQAAGAAA